MDFFEINVFTIPFIFSLSRLVYIYQRCIIESITKEIVDYVIVFIIVIVIVYVIVKKKFPKYDYIIDFILARISGLVDLNAFSTTLQFITKMEAITNTVTLNLNFILYNEKETNIERETVKLNKLNIFILKNIKNYKLRIDYIIVL